MIQLMMQIVATPVLNRLILRNKIKDRGGYAKLSIFAIVLFLLFECLTFNDGSADVNSLSQVIDIGGLFQLSIPRAY
jgi:hypothetical protein